MMKCYVQCRQTHNDALVRTRDGKREARLFIYLFIIIIIIILFLFFYLLLLLLLFYFYFFICVCVFSCVTISLPKFLAVDVRFPHKEDVWDIHSDIRLFLALRY
jgi:hypothetical protein